MVIRVTVQHRDTPDTLVSPVIRGILESQATPAMVGRATRDTAGLVIPVMAGQGIVDIPDYRAILVYPGTRLRGHQATPVTQEYQGIAGQVAIRAILV